MERSYGPQGNIAAAAQVNTVETTSSFFGKVHGFSGVTRSGAGVYVLTLGTNARIAPADRNIQLLALAAAVTGTHIQVDESGGTESSITVRTFGNDGVAADSDFDIIVFRKD